jgi:hypothetical protein
MTSVYLPTPSSHYVTSASYLESGLAPSLDHSSLLL